MTGHVAEIGGRGANLVGMGGLAHGAALPRRTGAALPRRNGRGVTATNLRGGGGRCVTLGEGLAGPRLEARSLVRAAQDQPDLLDRGVGVVILNE
jgi:hypothetical protein